MKQQQYSPQAIVLALVERFDDLEEETGADFIHAKRIILRWAEKNSIFSRWNSLPPQPPKE